jgi:16S rRNA processing protein RimM
VELQFPEDAVEVGRVMGAWGVKGWIKVQPFSLDPQALFSTKRWFLQAPQEASPITVAALATRPVLKVIQAKEHGDGVVACAQDVEDRACAEALRGARVFVSRASFPTATEGEHYWVDLIGLTVMNRQGVVLGEVVGLIETGAHDVLRIQPPGGDPASAAMDGMAVPGKKGRPGKSVRAGVAPSTECLIPFVAAYVDGVDTAQGLITVDWGLDY